MKSTTPVTCYLDILDSYKGELFGKVEAYLNDELVGFVQFSDYPDFSSCEEGDPVPHAIHIKYVHVNENLRRQGIATQMYEKIKEEFPGERIESSGTTELGGMFRRSLLDRGVITAATERLKQVKINTIHGPMLKYVCPCGAYDFDDNGNGTGDFYECDENGKPVPADCDYTGRIACEKCKRVFDVDNNFKVVRQGEQGALNFTATVKPEWNKRPPVQFSDSIREYGRKIVAANPSVTAVYLVGSLATKGQGNDIDILYELKDEHFVDGLDEVQAEQKIEQFLESLQEINLEEYDTFVKVGQRFFHLSGGAGYTIMENTEWAQEQSGKPMLKLATRRLKQDKNSTFWICACGHYIYSETTYQSDETGTPDPNGTYAVCMFCGAIIDQFKQKIIGYKSQSYNLFASQKKFTSTAAWDRLKKDFLSGIVYHGTTADIAERIMRDGFRGLDYDTILNEVMALYGKKWEDIDPTWQKIIEDNKRSYSHEFDTISTTPAGEVAIRFAGQGGEVPHAIERYILQSPRDLDQSESKLSGEPVVLQCRIKDFESTEFYRRAQQWIAGHERLVTDGGVWCRKYTLEEAAEDLWTSYSNFNCTADQLEPIRLIRGAALESLKKGPLPEGKQASKQEEPSKNANTQINLPKEIAWKLKELAKKVIKPEDLAGDGYEEHPHITVKYGVKEDEDGVIEAVRDLSSFEVTLGKTHVFEPSKSSDGAAPVVIKIDCPELQDLHKTIDEAIGSRKDDFEYTPHATLAYVKPEVAEKYDGLDFLEGLTFDAKDITLSKRDHIQITIPFGKLKTASNDATSSLTLAANVEGFPPLVIVRFPPKGMRWRTVLKIVKQIAGEVAGKRVPWRAINIFESPWGSYTEQEEQFPQWVAKGTHKLYDILPDGTFQIPPVSVEPKVAAKGYLTTSTYCPCGNKFIFYRCDRQGHKLDDPDSLYKTTPFRLCYKCNRIIDKRTDKVFGQVSDDLFTHIGAEKFSAERIQGTPNSDDWRCICGNEADGSGFTPCNENGREVEPDAEWDGHRVLCNACRRIIDQSTLYVIGWAGQLDCACGNERLVPCDSQGNKLDPTYPKYHKTRYRFCPGCKRITDRQRNKVIDQKSDDLFKNAAEKIKGTPKSKDPDWTNDDWVCGCGNRGDTDPGFFPCDEGGKIVYSTSVDWDGTHFKCPKCKRVIDAKTLRVVGVARKDLFGDIRVVSAEKVKDHGSGFLECVCHNTPGLNGFWPCDRDGNDVLDLVSELSGFDTDSKYYRCGLCQRIFNRKTLQVVGVRQGDLFKNSAERIKGTPKSTGIWRDSDWVCVCGNTPYDPDDPKPGFMCCDTNGKITSRTDPTWDRVHIRCMQCGRIIDGDTLKVKGVSSKDLFGNMRRMAADERIKELEDGTWGCPCGNSLSVQGFGACDKEGNRLDAREWDNTKYALCLQCYRVFDKKTNKVIGQASEGLFPMYPKNASDKLKYSLETGYECVCGNNSNNRGFIPCKRDGKIVNEQVEDWDGKYCVCDHCHRIYDRHGVAIDRQEDKQQTLLFASEQMKWNEVQGRTCVCQGDEFKPCKRDGTVFREYGHPDWDGKHIMCVFCRRIYDQNNGVCVGRGEQKTLFASSEKLKYTPNFGWECPCGDCNFYPSHRDGIEVEKNEWDHKYIICRTCGRVFSNTTNVCVGTKSKSLFASEKVKGTPVRKSSGNPDELMDWECTCGNVMWTKGGFGFLPCLPTGEATSDGLGREMNEWDGFHFRCRDCYAIINGRKMIVEGYVSKNLFGDMSKQGSEKITGTPMAAVTDNSAEFKDWVCVCGNKNDRTPHNVGFIQSDKDGAYVPDEYWDRKYMRCLHCGRIVNVRSLRVVGQLVVNMFGTMQKDGSAEPFITDITKTAGEKIKGKPNPTMPHSYVDAKANWECLCGNKNDARDTFKFDDSDNNVFYSCNSEGAFIPATAPAWDKRRVRCQGCGRIIDSRTMRVIGWATADLFGDVRSVPDNRKVTSSSEKIHGTRYHRNDSSWGEDLRCVCGARNHRFCDALGEVITYGEWKRSDEHYLVCTACGRVVDARTLKVTGMMSPDLFGGKSIMSSHKVTPLDDTTYFSGEIGQETNAYAVVPEKTASDEYDSLVRYFNSGSFLDYGFESESFDMGMSSTWEMNEEGEKLPPDQKLKVFVDFMRVQLHKTVETAGTKVVGYHGTNAETAQEIVKQGMRAGTFLATQKSGDFAADYYGDTVVRVEVDPDAVLIIEDTGDMVTLANQTIAKMASAETLTLYHVTTLPVAQKIKAEGFKPEAQIEWQNYYAPQGKDGIYFYADLRFSEAYAYYFARKLHAHGKGDPDLGIIEVQVPKGIVQTTEYTEDGYFVPSKDLNKVRVTGIHEYKRDAGAGWERGRKIGAWIPAEQVKAGDMLFGYDRAFRVTRDAYRELDEVVIMGGGTARRFDPEELVSVQRPEPRPPMGPKRKVRGAYAEEQNQSQHTDHTPYGLWKTPKGDPFFEEWEMFGPEDQPQEKVEEPQPEGKTAATKLAWREIEMSLGEDGNLLGGILENDKDLAAWAEDISYPVMTEMPKRREFVKRFKGMKVGVIDDMRVFNRGKGFGSKLLEDFIAKAKAAGCAAVILEAGVHEPQEKGFDLVEWYKRHGFEAIQRVGGLPLMVKWLKSPKTAAEDWPKWIGVDLDGTLAMEMPEFDPKQIGNPIHEMVQKVKNAIEDGKTVKVFTARMADKENREATAKLIREWTKEHIGMELEATNEKDPGCEEIWDSNPKLGNIPK